LHPLHLSHSIHPLPQQPFNRPQRPGSSSLVIPFIWATLNSGDVFAVGASFGTGSVPSSLVLEMTIQLEGKQVLGKGHW
jgi:hypothetical protein